MGKNDNLIKMKLTPQEALIIENIRSMQGKTEPVNRYPNHKDALMQKYMDMDDWEFMEHYAGAVGDDTILAVLQDTLDPLQKWQAIFSAIDEDVIDEMFDSYVSNDVRRELFLETQDREELCLQLIDLTMDGDWTPEN
jgi:hypothetical protein